MANFCVERCALLFGIPVSRSEFDERVSSSSPSDYLSNILGEDTAEDAWTKRYLPVSKGAQDLIEIATTLGARVFRRASLNDINTATAFHDQIVLMTHWKGYVVSKRDIRADLGDMTARIMEGSHPVLQEFRPPPIRAQALLDSLNSTIRNSMLIKYLPTGLQNSCKNSPILTHTLSRDLIDEALEGLVAPGNRVELFDGLHTVAETEQAIVRTFRGELDLATCNSEMFATFLDLRRGENIHHLHWPTVINPIPQFICIAETLRRLNAVGGSYIEARLSVERDLAPKEKRNYAR